MTVWSVSIPVSLTILPSHHSCPSERMSASAAAVAPQLGSSRRARAVAVWFSLGQHGPEDTRGLGGERYHDDLIGPAREQIPQPRIADTARSLMPQIGACPTDQQGSQHAVTLFGDTPRTMLAAGAMIATGQPDPGREIASAAEHLRIRHFGQDRTGDDRADARHLHQPASLAIGTGGLRDLSLEGALVSIYRRPVFGQHKQTTAHD